MGKTTNDRVIGVLLIALGLLGLLWIRCVWIQVVAAPRYIAFVRTQHESRQLLRARRGTIYDRNGRLLGVSLPAPSVFADARRVSSKQETAKRLSGMVSRDANMIQKQLERDKRFVWVARQVDLSLTPQIMTMGRDGIGIVEELKRVYPQGRLAGHLLGFTDIDQRGLESLELAFNGALEGHDGWRSTLRDARGKLLIGPWTTSVEPQDGFDLVLTIDSVVQQVAEEALDWGLKKYHGKGGSVIVMDPDTGAILAMANAPAVDPNAPGKSKTEHRRNRAVTDLFEPGSIFKIVTAAALLEEGRITPEEEIFCENGSYPTVARHILHDHRPHGSLTFHDVIKLSSNIGTAKAAQRLKPEELYRYIRAFGFGHKTGIDVPGEVNGLLSPPSRWSKLTPFIIPIGQEIATTPAQLAVMTAIIANGGLRVRPYLVDRIQTAEGRIVRAFGGEPPVRVISTSTAATLQTMLRSVVESGTGQLANVQGLTVAGKTGTAQKLEPTGRYSHSRFVASFVGFGPVPDSRFVITVSVDEPRPLYFGGVVSAPIFKRIVEQLASYWDLDRAQQVARLPGAAGQTAGMRR
jgi:cell division protein FtsI (penicillin-binding protein 3)